MQKIVFTTILALVGWTVSQAQQQAAPDTSLVWKQGYLDICHLYTGRGNAAFYILPDGTTMLVDAGDLDSAFDNGQTLHIAPAYPDNTLSSGARISSYIRQVMPAHRQPAIDYAVITHFHSDHYGLIKAQSPVSRASSYRLSGITAVAEEIPIGTLIDRNYPVYNYPVDLKKQYAGNLTFTNYLSFIQYQAAHNGMHMDSLQVGSTQQIRLRYQPAQYPSFQVMGIKCGGTVWNSREHKSYPLLQPSLIADAKGKFNENPLSLALKISYGPFDYFTGGDNTGLHNYDTPDWFDVETPIADAVGKVDVTTFNHHGNRDAMNEYFLKTLAPRVLVQQTWCSDHPGQELAHRLASDKLYNSKKDVFATYIHPETKVTYGSWFTNAYKSMEGHVIIRVFPGGQQYIVMIAETVNGRLQVKKVFGPYAASAGE